MTVMRLRGPSRAVLAIAVAAAIAIVVVGMRNATAAPYATDWIRGHNSKARLIVGGAPKSDGSIARYVALELALPKGWKTYWRQPGTSGGIPPQIDFTGSRNLTGTEILYPAPQRMQDPTGETIGYKRRLVLPVELRLADPSQPTVINLRAFFGVCREICIPAEAAFKVTLAPEMFRRTPPELATALTKLPVTSGTPGANTSAATPELVSVATKRDGSLKLVLDVRFAPESTGHDLFAETGNGRSLGMSRQIPSPQTATKRFTVRLDDETKAEAAVRHGLIITMVSNAGAAERRIAMPR